MSRAEYHEVWLLTGDRPGEVAQQRAVGNALGLRTREIQVAKLPASGRPEWETGAYLQPPFPALVITFGKCLEAAIRVRNASGGLTRIVHLGRPRGVPLDKIDLVIPMPADYGIEDAPNVLRISMPFNSPATVAARTDTGIAPWPRPVTTLVLGGRTEQHRLDANALIALVRTVHRRVRACGGTLLVSTSPRTPPEAVDAIKRIVAAPGEVYAFRSDDPDNPLARYLAAADQLIVTGDSASLVAEGWRSGKPLSVALMPYTLRYRLRLSLRRLLPTVFADHGILVAKGDINGWLKDLAAQGTIGMLGSSAPSRPYRLAEDRDLVRVVERIRFLLRSKRLAER